ncbi:MAG: inositol monophosphatase [Devosiaceae bacterium]|nr:inositol monophosphatase [Devosiaceae bacterium]
MNSEISRLEFAKSLALEAGKLAQDMRTKASNGFIKSKGLQDFVTEADREVERLIKTRIAAQYPDDAFLGEEGGSQGDSTSLWVVDPIDGTANYMRNLPDWAISIAFCQSNVIQIGVIYAPDMGNLAWAKLGDGAYVDDKPIHVSDCSDPAMALIMMGRSSRRPVKNYLNMVAAIFDAGMEYRRNGAATIGLLAVALGRAESYYEAHVNAWDAFAGMLLVTEAGGTSNHDGNTAFIQDGSKILVGNGHIDARLQAIIDLS